MTPPGTTGSSRQPTERSAIGISRIAVGVDGHPEGDDAAALGATIARATNAELTLVAVHPEPLVVLPEVMNWTSLYRQAASTLGETRQAFAQGAKTVVECDISVPRALARVIRRQHQDLLIVGSSRHAPEGVVRTGKRTRELLGQVDCALAIAPRGIREHPPEALRRIAVGFDGGGESYTALSLAGSIARTADAELLLCSVVDDRVRPATLSAEPAGTIARWEEGVEAEMEALREFGLAAARETDATVHAQVLRGRPADALLAVSSRVDLLVLGSRRWGRVARLLLGSTGEALAHDARCPILVVPRPRREHSAGA